MNRDWININCKREKQKAAFNKVFIYAYTIKKKVIKIFLLR